MSTFMEISFHVAGTALAYCMILRTQTLLGVPWCALEKQYDEMHEGYCAWVELL